VFRLRAHPARSLRHFMEAMMGSHSIQGWGLVVLFLAFTFLSIGLYMDGSIVFILLAAVTMVASIAIFLKAKPLEGQT
jgi:hypothetical protein